MNYTEYTMEVILFDQSDVVRAWSNQGELSGPDSINPGLSTMSVDSGNSDM